MDDSYWLAVQSLRLRLADLLESLEAAEWDVPSLCPGWRVRDVAGHVSVVPVITSWELLAAAPRAGFDLNRINTRLAVRHGSRRPEEIVAELRAHAGTRRTAKVLDTRNSLFDIVVHTQDIALPLGREFHVPADQTRRGLQRVWEMGWPFHARRRLTGVTLRATDADWTVGAGPEVAGPALSLLMLLTGRASPVRESLSGEGLPSLSEDLLH